MLPGRDVRRRHAFRYFQSARFLPFTVLLSATKSLSLSIHFSLLFLCKRRSSRFNSGSGPRATSLRLWVARLSDLRCMPRWNLRWMNSRRSHMLRRLCVNLGGCPLPDVSHLQVYAVARARAECVRRWMQQVFHYSKQTWMIGRGFFLCHRAQHIQAQAINENKKCSHVSIVPLLLSTQQ